MSDCIIVQQGTSIHSQKHGACFAYATSTVLTACQNRIDREKTVINESVLADILLQFGEDGGHVEEVLKWYINEKVSYLKFQELTTYEDVEKTVLGSNYLGNEGNQAKGRGVIFTFSLNDKQWTNFKNFFKVNPQGVITQADLNKDVINYGDQVIGHAVVIDGINKEEKYFHVKNSWGKGFADEGYCRMSYKGVDNKKQHKFYDVFYRVQDLPQNFKDYFNKKNNNNQ